MYKRQVYLDAMRQVGASPSASLYATFMTSIVVHEVVIWGIMRPGMPWLALFSLLQLPLGTIQRISVIKGKRLGNFILWMGLAVGISLLSALYARDYCAGSPRACEFPDLLGRQPAREAV